MQCKIVSWQRFSTSVHQANEYNPPPEVSKSVSFSFFELGNETTHGDRIRFSIHDRRLGPDVSTRFDLEDFIRPFGNTPDCLL